MKQKLHTIILGYVKWAGVNGLVEYAGDNVTAVLQAGLSNQQFPKRR